MVCVFQIIGKKDSGKTTIIERLIPKLKDQGYLVGIIKHSHHVIDDENKDTFKFRKAGGDLVFFASNDCALFFDCNNMKFIHLIPVDIILVEGFKDLNLGYKIETKGINDVDKIVSEVLDKAKECNEKMNLEIDGKRANKNLVTLFIFKLMKDYNIKEIKIAD
ncbi:molybdopterin-guanine dinucleotide biosynthesis protein B [Acidianus sulfidivorans JP7]|uniref:Molybdopterin-guanine dinucleotide biosynthesis protein B n=1 Tax=Acidianus sulfidivorans JP7 TaxID=619593 RepID=A0A2U9ILX6_9CREN|nr:molybdopterin-guanine dinucleotide biosynthesis protein B [Acidianus sulfidivorans]AWR97069.1 molybdopterin-guanine dinucleotide biosynthesis protein B [Acidianus sulfidivorans JP7]